MSKMTICLWFDRGKAREAADFYASVFPDSHVGNGHASAVDIPSAKVGEELTVEFTVLGRSLHRPEWRAIFQAEPGGQLHDPDRKVIRN